MLVNDRWSLNEGETLVKEGVDRWSLNACNLTLEW